MRKIHISSQLPKLVRTFLAAGLVLSAYVPVASAQGAEPPAGEAPSQPAPAGAPAPGPAPAAAPATTPAAAPTEEQKAASRAAFAEGEAALEKKDYGAALEQYTKANDAVPTVHAQYGIAMSLAGLNRKADAYDALVALVNSGESTRLGDEKLTAAKAQLDELSKIPGGVVLTVIPPGAAVSVDGQPQTGATPFELDLLPGDHVIAVTAEGYEAKELQVAVRPEAVENQTVELEPSPAPAAAAAPAAAPPAEPAPAAPPPQSRNRVPGWVTLGIAGAGAIVGTVFGVKALGAKKDFDSNPTTANADTVERDALIADMSFGVALTLGITGIVLLTTDDTKPSEVSAAKEKRTRSVRRLTVAPYAGRRGGGAAAHFTF